MDVTFWILTSIFVLIVVLAILALIVIYRDKKKRQTDYYSLFIMGLIWLVIGVPLKNYALFALGIIFSVVGMVHRDKWKKNRVRWHHLTAHEKKVRIAIMVALTLLLILGVAIFFMMGRGA